MGPRVAFDGQNYLVVWARQSVMDPTGYNHELRGARIQPDGTILDPGGFVIQAGPGLFRKVEVAHDGNNTFLVVWERDQVYFDPLAAPTSVIEGARVFNNGSVHVSNPVVIENSTTPAAYNRIGHSSPDVFFDGNDFRVTYQSMVKYTDDLNDIVEAQSGIYMKRVQPLSGNGTDKQVLVTFGSNVVGWDPKVTYSQGKGLLLFNGLTGHDQATGDPAIWSRWFTLSGGLNLSVLLPVVTDSSGLWNGPFQTPVVAGDEPDYVSVWSDLTVIGADNDRALSGAYGLSIQGTSTGWLVPTGPVLQACNDEDPRVAFNGSEFTVVDRHQHGCKAYVGVVNLDLEATPGVYDFLDFGGEPNLIHEPDVAFGSANGLAVFSHQNYPSNYNGIFPTYGIWGVFLDSGSSPP
jgi:hypothetical protein